MAPKSLTPGEKRVLKAYVDYETHAEAANALEISQQTIKNHLSSIYKKLGTRKAHSALYAYAKSRGVDIFDDTIKTPASATSASGKGDLTVEDRASQTEAQ